MELMLLPKSVTAQDKRALSLYFAIALLVTICFIFVMLYKADFRFSHKADVEQTPTPKPTPRNR